MDLHEQKTAAAKSVLSENEIRRYRSHLALPEVGPEGQAKLKAARVLLVGAGGLGAPAGLYLAAAGVGHLGIVDFDTVEIANLQRQVAFGTGDVGRGKALAMAQRLRDLNPEIEVVVHEARLVRSNAAEIFSTYDVVLDGSDNFATRYVVSDTCVRLGKPDVFGSVFRLEGQVSVFSTEDAPCYRCLYPAPPPSGTARSCMQAGVLGVLPGIVGSIQALEAMKLVLGTGETLKGRLLLFDGARCTFREIRIPKDPACPACGPGRRGREIPDEDPLGTRDEGSSGPVTC